MAYAISVESMFVENFVKDHWEALKWIFRYIKGSAYYGLMFGKNKNCFNSVEGFVDSDFASNMDIRKSLIGYVFT